MSAASNFNISAMELAVMMPMSVVVNARGHIVHSGPTIAKIMQRDVVGTSFFKHFRLRRPSFVTSIQDVRQLEGAKIYLRLKDVAETPLIGSAIVLADHQHVLLNLSFGYAVVEAVGQYDLTGSDFAATDLAVEMLYLVEAKSAAMVATAERAHLLHGEKTAAQNEAMTDGLTGLSNRRALQQFLWHQIRRRGAFSILQIDLDLFKQVNDTLGHAAGDTVLTHVAAVLREETRESDLVARVGGDEFVAVLTNFTHPERLLGIASRIISRLEEPINFKTEACRISASIGIVSSETYEDADPDDMMEDADLALYRSKRAGRAQATFFDPRDRDAQVKKQQVVS